MADPLLPMTLGIGASLVKVLLQANDYVTEANFVEVIKEGCDILSWWMNRGDDARDQLAKQIAEILAYKTHDMYEECRGKGIDEEWLGGVVTEVEILFNKVVGNDELLLLAVNDPDSFSEVLQGDIGQRRKNIESRLEPYFDKLVEAAVDEYVELAPWSPKFQIEALKYISDNVCKILGISIEILENSIKSLENHEITHEKLDDVMDALLKRGPAEVASKVSVQKPLIFGRRPYVVESYYIEREEQVRLRNLINEDPRLRVVLVGMRGCGKSQLASELAWSCEEKKWHLVAWINATSKEQVRSGLIELADRLGIETQGRNEESIIEQCFSYLGSGEPSDRLIVFDNVEDINDLTGLVPLGDGLRVVVTTTNDCGWKNQSWDQIKIGVFSREDSIEFYEQMLAEREWVLGPDHPYTLTARNNLAGAYKSVGRFGEAIELYEQVLAERERVLGPDHPDTLNVRSNLASAYDSVGRFGEAIELFEQVLAERERVLGPDHPDTLHARNNLAVAYLSVGRFGEAIELFEQVLAKRKRLLGADHPDTLSVRNNLAVAYLSVGRFGEAIELFEQVLAKRERLLGPDNPVTLQARNNLAAAYGSVGRFGEAIELFEQVLAKRERLLGADHPDTLNARNNLAGAYDSVGRLAEAIDTWEELLPDCQRLLGPDHPDTLGVRDNLAGAYDSVGRLAEVIDAWEKLLPDCQRLLGPDHPDTLNVRNDLAVAYHSVGRFAEAIDAWEKLLPDYQRVLGLEHPLTKRVEKNLEAAKRKMNPPGASSE